MLPLHHDPVVVAAFVCVAVVRTWHWSPRNRPRRSRTVVSALSGRRPQPLNDRAELSVSDPCGIRTQPRQLERLATSPEVERAVLCARSPRNVGREALESSSPGLQPGATPSQLPTLKLGKSVTYDKKTRRPDDSGLWSRLQIWPSHQRSLRGDTGCTGARPACSRAKRPSGRSSRV